VKPHPNEFGITQILPRVERASRETTDFTDDTDQIPRPASFQPPITQISLMVFMRGEGNADPQSAKSA
jgi:hypothetical protein